MAADEVGVCYFSNASRSPATQRKVDNMGFQDDFAQAMSQTGYNINASAVPDAGALESGLTAALQWYQSLDPTTRDAIDAATADPGQASVALSQAGVASGIDSLLQSFDQIQGKLGDMLQAAQQALQTAQQSNP